MKHKDLTAKIIECAYKVYNTLGYGFLESVYQSALLIELPKTGLGAEKEKRSKSITTTNWSATTWPTS